MRLKAGAAAGLGAILTLGLGGVASQARAQQYVPAEMPPASYTEPQYVDSEGCVFVRADYGGAVRWVPQMNSDRGIVCGHTPSVAPTVPVASVTVAANPAARATVAMRAPYSPTPTSPPVPRDPSRVSHSVSVGGLAPVVTHAPKPQNGWTTAFDDGRLNPYRGPRTVQGNAQMRARWTEETPMQLRPTATPDQVYVEGSYPPVPKPRIVVAPTVTMSSKSVAPVGSNGKQYVQVGSFGNVANVVAATKRLQALGLPVATSKTQELTVVYAGPFYDTAKLNSALASARRAGFPDALVR